VCTCAAQVILQLQPGSTATTIAGSGKDGNAAQGAAVASPLGFPRGMAYDASGALLLTDSKNHVIVQIRPDGTLTVVAGTGRQGYTGDGGLATAAEFNAPESVIADTAGNVYIADTGNHRIRKVDPSGNVSTIVGTGAPGNAGDNGPATAAQLRQPRGLALDTNGNLYIADTGNHRIRELRTDGTLIAIAGTGAEGNDGDGALATAATLESPAALTLTTDGSLLIADTAARRIRRVSSAGIITTYTTVATLRPEGIAADKTNSLYIADAGKQALVQSTQDGTSSIAGTGEQGVFTAGSPTASPLDSPAAVTLGNNGDVLLSDRHNHQVQRIALPRIDFGSVAIDTTSAAQTITMRNAGAQPLQVLALNLPTGFSTTSVTTCGATPFVLQPAGSCTESIAFTPSAQGAQSGVAQVHMAGAAPQSMLLSGTGIAVNALSNSVTTLTSDGSISYTGAPIVLTVTVVGSLSNKPAGAVSLYDSNTLLSTASLTGGAAQISTSSLTLGQHTLHASYSGDAHYAASTSGIVTQTVVAAPDFTMTSPSATYSGAAGDSIDVPITLTPINGTLNHAVAFSVTGLPASTSSTFLPAAITLGGNPVPVVLTLQMAATQGSSQSPLLPTLAGGLLIAFTLTVRRKKVPLFALVLIAVVCSGGCGSGFRAVSTGGKSGGTPVHYNVVVTATTTGVLGDALTHSATIGLVVTP
jgi:sugar lactone lactonase YvrE